MSFTVLVLLAAHLRVLELCRRRSHAPLPISNDTIIIQATTQAIPSAVWITLETFKNLILLSRVCSELKMVFHLSSLVSSTVDIRTHYRPTSSVNVC